MHPAAIGGAAIAEVGLWLLCMQRPGVLCESRGPGASFQEPNPSVQLHCMPVMKLMCNHNLITKWIPCAYLFFILVDFWLFQCTHALSISGANVFFFLRKKKRGGNGVNHAAVTKMDVKTKVA